MNWKCRADKCIYPINCANNQQCLSTVKEKPMGDTNNDKNRTPKWGEHMPEHEQEKSEKHYFESGAGSSGHKPPYECLTPRMIRRSALRMQLGLHYGKHNWKKGSKEKAFILDRLNHAVEHLLNAMGEIDSDQLMTDDDLAAVIVNCMMAMEYQAHLYSEKQIVNPNI